MAFFLKKKVFYTLFTVAVIAIFGFFYFNREPEYNFEIEPVAPRDIVQVVSETGIVESGTHADLSFDISGRLEQILVKEGEKVEKGELLAALKGDTLYADVLSAKANLDVQNTRLNELLSNTSSGDGIEYQQLVEQQNNAVQNAYRSLLSTDLEAYSVDDFGTGSAPIISGIYNSDEQGDYFIDVFASSAQSGASFSATGLEKSSGPASQTSAVPLGTRGLFIKFPAGTIDINKRWIVSIPNKRSSTYATRLNAYEAANKTRDLTLSQNESSTYSISIAEAQIDQALAALNRAEVAYENTRLFAPFSGIISEIYLSLGETVSALTPVVSLFAESSHEIEVFIPEDDIAYIEIGDSADIMFDAYQGEIFKGYVQFVAPSAINREGVNVFKIIVAIEQVDERIRAGLSADVEIVAEVKESVLAVPTRAVVYENNEEHVRIFNGNEVALIPVTTGLQGSDGYIEIRSGLNQGQEIITFIDEDTLESLSKK